APAPRGERLSPLPSPPRSGGEGRKSAGPLDPSGQRRPIRHNKPFFADRTEGVMAMPLGLLGLKVGMTQVYDANGKIAPVTVLQAGPCPVLQVKTKGQKRDGSDRNGA